MGPTNVALVQYFKADQELREALARLDAASKDVRVQDRRVNDLSEKLKVAQQKQRENQSRAGAMELDLKARDAHIEKLRTQQQNARNNKEYQTFLVEINTAKVEEGATVLCVATVGERNSRAPGTVLSRAFR
jgi:predicted  nucleic acid-binding Zn-ribbon protein